MPPITSNIVNHLIDSLPPWEATRLLARCETTDLAIGDVLNAAGRALSHAYFPQTSMILLTETVANHRPLAVGLIGSEGMLGATLVLDSTSLATTSTVQGSGEAWRISRTQLRRALAENPALLRTLKQYLSVVMMQLSQATACIRFHRLEPRLARWLLMMQDRAHADRFYITHDLLASMLGVRRSGITVAAGNLQQLSLIRYHRGVVRILDRPGLEDASCECYAAMAGKDKRVLG